MAYVSFYSGQKEQSNGTCHIQMYQSDTKNRKFNMLDHRGNSPQGGMSPYSDTNSEQTIRRSVSDMSHAWQRDRGY